MISSTLKSQLSKISTIILAWTFISIFQFFLGWGTLLEYECDISDRNIWVPFKASILTGVSAGFIGGFILVFLWERWLRTKPYGWTLLNIFLTYVGIFVIVAALTSSFFQVNEFNLPFFHPKVWQEVYRRMVSFVMLIPFTFWLIIVLSTMIVFQVNDKYGPGVFKDFLLGKYFQPKREERVFMFMDLRSSTKIAEQLGEALYFNFLRDVFRVATPAVLKHKGEVYQYVGDEMVVSWKTSLGIEDANCVQCFFDVQQLLANQQPFFQETYGVCPEFKAGLHYGHVMAGEIGVVKRDIAFSGDVLNTTARIQEKCNELGVDVLISKFLVQKMKAINSFFSPKEIGEMELKGKEQRVVLFTV